MGTIINILLFLLILGTLVTVHEFGHFICAKKSGVHIYEFSIGMGKAIKTFKGKDGIDYSIRMLPIGGYVQMAGEVYEDDDTKKIPKEKFLCNRPWYQRLIILCAGVFNNFLLAVILLFTIACIWGAPTLKPVVYEVEEGTPAAEAGIQSGDTILKINNKKVTTLDRMQLLLLLKDKDNTYEIQVKHENGEKETVEVTPNKVEIDGQKVNRFGISTKATIRKGVGNAFKYSFQKLVSVMDQMLITVGNLFTGKISLNQLSGPVGIYSVVGESRKSGIQNVIYLAAYLSINLGIMNILPIPALDGGHVLFLFIEMITRKKVNEKVEAVATNIFFALLMLLMIYISIHDIIKLF